MCRPFDEVPDTVSQICICLKPSVLGRGCHSASRSPTQVVHSGLGTLDAVKEKWLPLTVSCSAGEALRPHALTFLRGKDNRPRRALWVMSLLPLGLCNMGEVQLFLPSPVSPIATVVCWTRL